MREMFIDYNHIGHGCRFRIRLFRSEREGWASATSSWSSEIQWNPARRESLRWPRMAARLSWNS